MTNLNVIKLYSLYHFSFERLLDLHQGQSDSQCIDKLSCYDCQIMELNDLTFFNLLGLNHTVGYFNYDDPISKTTKAHILVK
jgi:hypothetical protein